MEISQYGGGEYEIVIRGALFRGAFLLKLPFQYSVVEIPARQEFLE